MFVFLFFKQRKINTNGSNCRHKHTERDFHHIISTDLDLQTIGINQRYTYTRFYYCLKTFTFSNLFLFLLSGIQVIFYFQIFHHIWGRWLNAGLTEGHGVL